MFWFSYITLLIALTAAVYELRRCLMMLQQNSYRNERYNRWLSTSQDSTSIRRLVSGAVVLAAFSTLSIPVVSLGLVCAVSLLDILNLVRARYKKPLVWTPRARRIYAVTALLAVIVVAASFFMGGAGTKGAGVAAIVLSVYTVSPTCSSLLPTGC